MNTYKKLETFKRGMFTSLVEVWKDIEGYEDIYQISSFGRVKSLSRWRDTRSGSGYVTKEKIMSPKTSKTGYLNIGLHSGGKKFFSIHRLVATAFVPNPGNKPTVNHIDGVKTNNSSYNLEWSTHSEQMIHAVEMNLVEKRGSPKFSKAFKASVLKFAEDNPDFSILEISKKFEMSERTAGRILNEGVKPRPTTRILKDGRVIVENILTKSQVEEIKYLRSQGWTFKMLSEKFDRGLSQMHRVCNNLSRVTEIE